MSTQYISGAFNIFSVLRHMFGLLKVLYIVFSVVVLIALYFGYKYMSVKAIEHNAVISAQNVARCHDTQIVDHEILLSNDSLCIVGCKVNPVMGLSTTQGDYEYVYYDDGDAKYDYVSNVYENGRMKDEASKLTDIANICSSNPSRNDKEINDAITRLVISKARDYGHKMR